MYEKLAPCIHSHLYHIPAVDKIKIKSMGSSLFAATKGHIVSAIPKLREKRVFYTPIWKNVQW